MSNEYVVVTKDQDIYGPFSTKEEADKEAETLRDATGEVPYVTNEEVYVKKAKENMNSEVLSGRFSRSEREMAISLANKILENMRKSFPTIF